jgi:hypothetical protein
MITDPFLAAQPIRAYELLSKANIHQEHPRRECLPAYQIATQNFTSHDVSGFSVLLNDRYQ